MRKDGAITIFLSLIFVCVAALIFGLVESARTAGVNYYLQTAADSALDSVFSEFDNKLWEKYRLILRNYKSEDELKSRFSNYINPYIESSGIYKISNPQVEVLDKQVITDEGGAWLEDEIAEYVKYKIASDLIFETDPNKVWEEVKNADSMKNITNGYAQNSREAIKVEKALMRISENLNKQRNAYNYAMGNINGRNVSGFLYDAREIERLNNKIDSLVDNYSRCADKLLRELDENEREHAADWDKLNDENRQLLEKQIENFRPYVDKDGERRIEVDNLKNEAHSISSSLTQSISIAEEIEYIEESEDDDEEDDDDTLPDLYNDLSTTWSEVSIPTVGFAHGVGDEKKADILERLMEGLSNGVLELVIPADRDVSDKSIDLTYMPSNADRTVRNEPNADLIKNLLVDYYVGEYFPDFVDNVEDDFSYEFEYILSGKNTDKANLEQALLKILLIRQGLNYLYIFRDSAKMELVNELALAISSAAAMPFLTGVVSFLIISAWVLAESVLDIKALLAGEEVPLFKTEETWRLDFDGVLAIGQDKNTIKNSDFSKTSKTETPKETEGGGKIMVYDMYLKLILFLVKPEDRNYRMLDMIENNMRKVESDFKARNLLYGTKLSTLCQSDRLFSRLGLVKGEFLGLSDNYNLKVNSVKVY